MGFLKKLKKLANPLKSDPIAKAVMKKDPVAKLVMKTDPVAKKLGGKLMGTNKGKVTSTTNTSASAGKATGGNALAAVVKPTTKIKAAASPVARSAATNTTKPKTGATRRKSFYQ